MNTLSATRLAAFPTISSSQQLGDRSDTSISDSSVEIDLDNLVGHSTPPPAHRTHGTSSSISSRHQLGLGKPGGQHGQDTLQQPPFAPRHRQSSSLAAATRPSSSRPRINLSRRDRSTSPSPYYGGLYKRTLSGYLFRSYRRSSLGEKLVKLLFLACLILFASALCGFGHTADASSSSHEVMAPRQRQHKQQPSYTEHAYNVPGTALLDAQQKEYLERRERRLSEAQMRKVAQLALQQQENIKDSDVQAEIAQEADSAMQTERHVVEEPFIDEPSRKVAGRDDSEEELKTLQEVAEEMEKRGEAGEAVEPMKAEEEAEAEGRATSKSEQDARQEEIQPQEPVAEKTALGKPALALRRAGPLAARQAGVKAVGRKAHSNEDIFEQHLAAKLPRDEAGR